MRKFFQEKGYFSVQRIPTIRFRFASAALMLLLVVFGGTASYAYASERVLPDTILYPVREKIENLEERLALTPQRKERVLARHQERRLREAKLLLVKQKPLPNLHKVLLKEATKKEEEKRQEKRRVERPAEQKKSVIERKIIKKEKIVQKKKQLIQRLRKQERAIRLRKGE